MEEEKKPENEVKNNDIEKIDVPLDEITSEDITEASFDSELLLKAIHDHNTEELKRIFSYLPENSQEFIYPEIYHKESK